jgi:hypothetical protein
VILLDVIFTLTGHLLIIENQTYSQTIDTGKFISPQKQIKRASKVESTVKSTLRNILYSQTHQKSHKALN